MKTAIVTGANAGLGFEITKALAKKGYRTIMACRNASKAEKARENLLEQVPGATLEIMLLDMSELDSIKEFAARANAEIGVIDLLVNNAGIALVPLARNSKGYEMHLATNYLGVFALTKLLLPALENSSSGRIVNVGSLMHRFVKFDFDDINWDKTEYKEGTAYGRSKLALQTFTQELAVRLQNSGSKIALLSAHPGFAATEISKGHRSFEDKNLVSRWFHKKMEKLVPTADKAASATILAATSEQVQAGEYYGPGGFLEIGGKPKKAKISKHAKNKDDARRLWALSEKLCDLEFSI